VTRYQNKVDQSPGGIAGTDDLAAETASRTPQGLLIAVALAIGPQTQVVGLLGRAPAAFYCGRTRVPSMQANSSFGSLSDTIGAMILSHASATVQRWKRR
jgi:hypothetical protein